LPLYEYECQSCHTRFEKIEKLSGPHMKKCTRCKGRVERVVSRTAIQFKGSGWYVTDYARPSSPPAGDSSAKESGAKDSTGTATPESAPATGTDGKAKPKPAAASKGKKAGGEK
jgi:putative FmdB family regulatory protein